MRTLLSLIAILLFFFVSSFGISKETLREASFEITSEWQEYATVDGVRIEFRMKTCTVRSNREESLVLFRYTNTTNLAKTISWKTKIWRNGICSNCDKINRPEYAHKISLEANEVIEADGTSKENSALYIFGNYIKHVQGMSNQRLTNFELIELTSI